MKQIPVPTVLYRHQRELLYLGLTGRSKASTQTLMAVALYVECQDTATVKITKQVYPIIDHAFSEKGSAERNIRSQTKRLWEQPTLRQRLCERCGFVNDPTCPPRNHIFLSALAIYFQVIEASRVEGD